MVATTFAPAFEVTPFTIGTRIPMQQRYRQYANEFGLDETTALLNVLIGAVAGTTATKSRTRVKPNSGSAADNGGKMGVEVFTPINRASTAADVTALKALFAGVRRAPAAYVRDLSGNGGPAFTPG
jgi:hypothetical protein